MLMPPADVIKIVGPLNDQSRHTIILNDGTVWRYSNREWRFFETVKTYVDCVFGNPSNDN